MRRIAGDVDHGRVNIKKLPRFGSSETAGKRAQAKANHRYAQRASFPYTERPDHLVYGRSVMIVSDQLWATIDRLAIFVGDYLCAMDRRPVLEDPVPPVVGVVDFVHSEKAAQGHNVVLADRIDPNRDERDRNSKRGLGRIAEQNN